MLKDKVNLQLIIEGCRQSNRLSQRRLYEHFYGYALNIALRYGKNKEEAREILNDGFLKIFQRIDQYDPSYPFKGWLRKVMINTAIDYFRAQQKNPHLVGISSAGIISAEAFSLPTISKDEDMLPVIQQLPPAYRMVFNLYVMEEYKHHEIAARLGISVGTSKSNLARAKEKLRAILLEKRNQASKTK